jgi:hypothetical protein
MLPEGKRGIYHKAFSYINTQKEVINDKVSKQHRSTNQSINQQNLYSEYRRERESVIASLYSITVSALRSSSLFVVAAGL